MYESATALYGPSDGAHAADNFASFVSSGKGRRQVGNLPDPGTAICLGGVLELHRACPDGSVEVIKMRRSTPLIWSPSRQAIYAIEGLRVGAPKEAPRRADNAADGYEKWHQRPPRGASQVDFPTPALGKPSQAVAIVYRSDKWHLGRNTDYIHHFGPGVWMAASRGNPRSFYVKGGALAMRPEGLVH